jgi:hypothetical protein
MLLNNAIAATPLTTGEQITGIGFFLEIIPKEDYFLFLVYFTYDSWYIRAWLGSWLKEKRPRARDCTLRLSAVSPGSR